MRDVGGVKWDKWAVIGGATDNVGLWTTETALATVDGGGVWKNGKIR